VNWKKALELAGESLREIGLLMFVFAPLDTMLKSAYGTKEDWFVAGCVGVLGLTLMAVGIVIGSKT